MLESVVAVSYGRPATRALCDAVASAKAGAGPLAPVTVVVPSNLAGLTARRLLGSDAVGVPSGAPDGAGIVNVAFVTPFRLAEILAADVVTDRAPLTNPVLGAAVRLALADDPGPYARAADHHATEAALAALHAELSNLDDEALDRLHAAGAGPAVTFHRAVRARLGGFHDEADIARAAATRPDLPQVVAPLGTVVWYVPAPTTSPLLGLLAAVLHAAPATAIVGITGDADADRAVWATVAAAGVTPPSEPGARPTPPIADLVVSASDADDEVRAVVRSIAAAAEGGVPLDRIGVFHPSPEPYAGILDQQLATAGIPANGPARRRLADTVAGRTLLAALALPGQRWRRDRVLALVADAPIRHDGELVRSGAWETISRQAGIVHDLADWRIKLDRHRDALVDRLDEVEARFLAEREAELAGERDAALDGGSAPSDPEDGAAVDTVDGVPPPPPFPRLDGLRRGIADTERLAGFVFHLADRVRAVEQAEGWTAKASAADQLLTGLLGRGGRHGWWPEAEQQAFERIQDVLVRLAALGDLEEAPSREVFLRALTSELDVTRGRTGRFGEGVVVGPLASAPGHDLDLVFVVGCVEGVVPARRQEDSLLSDAARSASGLELRGDRLHHQHRAFLAALAAAPDPSSRVLTVPRGDLRGNRRAVVSRWVLPSVTARAGIPIRATAFDALTDPVIHLVPSFAAGTASAAVAASVHDRDLGVLTRHVGGGGRLADHPLAALAGRGWRLQEARHSAAFTAFDGNLAGQPIPSAADAPQSPTRLQTWAECGYRYFLSSLLGLSDRDDPERVIAIDPLDRGSGVHEVLERFVGEAILAGPPSPTEPWDDGRRARVQALAHEVFAAYEARGRTGRPVHWRIVRADLLAMLDEFLTADDSFRRANGATPERVELPFGFDGVEPVVIALPDGRSLAFRGFADRVDRDARGRVIVTDYKTGKGSAYEKIDEGDPVRGGRTLQLGIYAEAALQVLGAPEAAAHYWMVDSGTGFRRHGYDWDEPRRARFLDVVTGIADGIEAGVFPMVPGDWDDFRHAYEACRFCPFDRICPNDRGDQAEAKLDAPELRRRDVLDWVPDRADDDPVGVR